MIEITEELLNSLRQLGTSCPIPLEEGNLKKSFLYDREFGYFPVNAGGHQLLMATLYAWHQGYKNIEELCKTKGFSKYGNEKYEEIADKYIEDIEGTCFKSSVSRNIIGGKIENFNESELDIFSGRMTYLD